MTVAYHINEGINISEFIEVLEKSGLGERRPIDRPDVIQKMLEHCNLLISARNEQNQLIGVARSLTDFSYCCYLSCLAVDESYKNKGIGKELIRRTMLKIGETATLILLAAPGAEKYYDKLGFSQSNNAYIIQRGDSHQAVLQKLQSKN